MSRESSTFPKGSISEAAHRGYLYHVWQAWIFSVGPTFIRNRFLFGEIWSGIIAVFTVLFLLLMALFSPLTSWVVGYLRVKETRKKFKKLGGEFVGKFAKYND